MQLLGCACRAVKPSLGKPSPSLVAKRFEDNMGTSLAVSNSNLELSKLKSHLNLVVHPGTSTRSKAASRGR
jgi:hypothetical protein